MKSHDHQVSHSLATTGLWPHLHSGEQRCKGWVWLTIRNVCPLDDLTIFQPSWEEKGELFIIMPR